MSKAIETIVYRGYTIETHYDESYDSPDVWENDDVFVVYDHREFDVRRKGFAPTEIFEHIEKTKRAFYDGHFVFPLYAYIHSGIALSLGRDAYPFTCNWDTSYRGFVLVRRDRGVGTRKKALELAAALVDEWNDCLSGAVYGYTSEAGSCWSFYGKSGYDEMIVEAKSEIDALIRDKANKHFAQLKVWIRNRVPYEYRKQFQTTQKL